ncbi:MAG: CvpA family protein [Betaproteobacteria bacterium]|nr:CvpA family protein [Betaproteobacteria bacterium]
MANSALTLFDYAVLGILAVSVLLGVVRGAVREVFSLGAWIGAFFIARALYEPLSIHAPEGIASPALRLLAAFTAIFVCALLLLMFVSRSLSQLVKHAGLGTLDRALGSVFGTFRGALIAVVLVLVAGLTPLPREVFWRNAMFSPPLEAAAKGVLPFMPEAFQKRVAY